MVLFKIIFFLLLFIQSINSIRQAPANTCCDNDHTLLITGTGRITLPTNVIRLGFTIETKENNAANAFQMNSKISASVDQVLRVNNKIEDKNITTISYQMAAKYNSVYNDSNRTYSDVFDGYVVTNQLDVKLSDKTMAASLIDRLVQVGVTKINYINFDVDQDLLLESKKNLLSLAVKDAQDRAMIVADTASLAIFDVKTVSVNDYIPPTPITHMAMNFAMRADTGAESNAATLYSSEKQITMSINIVFIVKRK